MLGDVDPLDFILAEKLSMSLSEVRALPNTEFVEWAAFIKYEREMAKLGRG